MLFLCWDIYVQHDICVLEKVSLIQKSITKNFAYFYLFLYFFIPQKTTVWHYESTVIWHRNLKSHATWIIMSAKVFNYLIILIVAILCLSWCDKITNATTSLRHTLWARNVWHGAKVSSQLSGTLFRIKIFNKWFIIRCYKM